MTDTIKRIRYLDGLRGLAILLVMGCHYCGPAFNAKSRYGNNMSWIPPLIFGWIGVYLFFLISGYVIFMTLEKSANLGSFLKRRWLRLFPAMAIVSIIIFTLSHFFAAFTPYGPASLLDLLPGLTFIAEQFWHAIVHHNINSLDTVFWTLYVEAGFYIVIGILYFAWGWKRALLALIGLWLIVSFTRIVVADLPKVPLSRAIEPLEWLGMMHYGWFAAGALFYKAQYLGSNRLYIAGTVIGLLSAILYTNHFPPSVLDHALLVCCVIIFAAAQRSAIMQALLQSRIALFFGLISYPLYLIHNVVGIGLMGVIGDNTSQYLKPFLPLIIIPFVFFLAWLIARHIEPWFRGALSNALNILDVTRTRLYYRGRIG